jgi:hypothetical protein
LIPAVLRTGADSKFVFVYKGDNLPPQDFFRINQPRERSIEKCLPKPL